MLSIAKVSVTKNHDIFSRNTLKQFFDALLELMTAPNPSRQPIGFINPRTKARKIRNREARLEPNANANARRRLFVLLQEKPKPRF